MLTVKSDKYVSSTDLAYVISLLEISHTVVLTISHVCLSSCNIQSKCFALYNLA